MTKVSAQEIHDLWNENEKTMGEMAAFSVSCEMLGLTYEEGLDIIHEDASLHTGGYFIYIEYIRCVLRCRKIVENFARVCL